MKKGLRKNFIRDTENARVDSKVNALLLSIKKNGYKSEQYPWQIIKDTNVIFQGNSRDIALDILTQDLMRENLRKAELILDFNKDFSFSSFYSKSKEKFSEKFPEKAEILKDENHKDFLSYDNEFFNFHHDRLLKSALNFDFSKYDENEKSKIKALKSDIAKNNKQIDEYSICHYVEIPAFKSKIEKRKAQKRENDAQQITDLTTKICDLYRTYKENPQKGAAQIGHDLDFLDYKKDAYFSDQQYLNFLDIGEFLVEGNLEMFHFKGYFKNNTALLNAFKEFKKAEIDRQELAAKVYADLMLCVNGQQSVQDLETKYSFISVPENAEIEKLSDIVGKVNESQLNAFKQLAGNKVSPNINVRENEKIKALYDNGKLSVGEANQFATDCKKGNYSDLQINLIIDKLEKGKDFQLAKTETNKELEIKWENVTSGIFQELFSDVAKKNILPESFFQKLHEINLRYQSLETENNRLKKQIAEFQQVTISQVPKGEEVKK